MSRYKLINKQTNEEHICSKMVIDGFDYYVSDKSKIFEMDFVYHKVDNVIQQMIPRKYQEFINNNYTCFSKVIATNNPSINLPKVIDEVERLAKSLDKSECRNFKREYTLKEFYEDVEDGFIKGYCQSQESHPFSEEDMIEFMEWCNTTPYAFEKERGYQTLKDMTNEKENHISTKEPLQIWKEQRIKTIYYN